MRLQFIHEVFDAAALPRMTKPQLLALAGTNAGTKLAKAINDFSAGQEDARRILDLAARALSPATALLAAAAGLKFPGMLALTLALSECDAFFKALAIAGGSSSAGRAAAAAYLIGLGAVRANTRDVSSTTPPYYSFKVFGRSAALCFAEARTRADNLATINIEGAIGQTEAGRIAYDWRSKIIVQLSAPELFQALALFEQKITRLRLDGHGNGHDKFIHFEVQDGNYFVKMAQKGRGAIAVPVTASDAIRVVSLLYKQIGLNEPHLEVRNIGDLLDRMAHMLRQQHQ